MVCTHDASVIYEKQCVILYSGMCKQHMPPRKVLKKDWYSLTSWILEGSTCSVFAVILMRRQSILRVVPSVVYFLIRYETQIEHLRLNISLEVWSLTAKVFPPPLTPQFACVDCVWIECWCYCVELRRRIQAMEMRRYLKILRISYRDHVTNKEVCAKIQQATGPHKDLLTIVKRRKLQWYGHVSCWSDLAKTILQGTV